MTDRHLVAIDDGYAQIKVFGDNPEGGAPIKKVFRTSVRSGRYGLKSLQGESLESYRAEEGEEFTVSELVAAENTQFDGFHTSNMNRVLVHHGLSLAGYDGKNVDLITGLPVADYFLNESIDQGKIDAKRSNLLKGVTRVSSSRPLANIGDVDVGCQAVAAWFDYVLDDNLEFRVDAGKRIAIVDIGGRTTDIAVIVGGRQIDHSQSGTQNTGVLDVYKALKDLIRQRFSIRDDIPLADLDQAVRTGAITLWDEDQPIEDLVKTALSEVDSKIAREVERRLGSAAALGAVVVVGGGGALFKQVPAAFRNGVLAEDPEFSNARGLWKFSRLQQRAEQAA